MRYLILLAGLSVFLSAAERPAPIMTGPVAATAAPGDPSHDYPFFAALQDLKSHGYVEQEFFIQGTADRYETPAAENGKVTDSGHAYKTRVVVRRPASRSEEHTSE